MGEQPMWFKDEFITQVNARVNEEIMAEVIQVWKKTKLAER